MKKIILTLSIVLLAAPAWADISITATDLGNGVVGIDYSGNQRARAFALDIMVDAGAITAIGEFAIGDDNNGYGIFPANFSRFINVDPETGEVVDWTAEGYTPIANPDDPGALGGLGSNGITIELGSLYDTKAPAMQGRLCTVTCSQPCKLTVTTNAIRGNVVLENGSEATVNLSGATEVQVGESGISTFSGLNSSQWELVGKPRCWVSSVNPRQCHGDADGLSQSANKYWVSTNDLDILIAAWNKPLNQLTGNQICADFDHLPQGQQQYRVSSNDLDILIANWQIADGPAPDCP